MQMMREAGAEVVIYEPTLESDTFNGFRVIYSLAEFAEQSDVIAANRMTAELNVWRDKVYTRDIFLEN